jgi:hypothetical protein
VPLVKRTAKHFDISEVSADKAYPSHWNMETVDDFGGTPFLAFKTNTAARPEGRSGVGADVPLLHVQQGGIHGALRQEVQRRAVSSAVKAKFGHSVRPKCDGGQVNEVLTKVLCHNMCILIRVMRELGVETTFGAGSGIEPKLFGWRAFWRETPQQTLTISYIYVKCT